MNRFAQSVFFQPVFWLVLILVLGFGLLKLKTIEEHSSSFDKIGTLEGCNVYHHNGTYGGSSFAICHK